MSGHSRASGAAPVIRVLGVERSYGQHRVTLSVEADGWWRLAAVRVGASGRVLFDPATGRRVGLTEIEQPSGDAALDARLEALAEQRVGVLHDVDRLRGQRSQ